MLTHPTLDQMHALGLSGMAAAYRDLANQPEGSDLNRDEWLGLMLDREMAVRGDKRLTNRLAIAKLRFPDACIENIDFAAPRGLDRRQLLSLAQGEWLKAHEHLILTGQTGTGKTWLACAIGRGPPRLFRSLCPHAPSLRGFGASAPRRAVSPIGRQARACSITHP
jgi:DNA replication protein DnaC